MPISSQADTNKTRTCSKCSQTKPISEFYFRASKGFFECRCKDCVSKQNREYYERKGETVRQAAREYRENNPGKYKDYLKRYAKGQAKLIKETVVRHYGGKCACCGEKDIRFLTIDHVNNDGREHRRLIGRSSLYLWLLRYDFPDTYELQCLCFNCNFGKNHNGGVCPHVSEGSETIRKE